MKRLVPQLTVEELQSAILAGAGAYDAKTESEPLASRTQFDLQEAEEAIAASLPDNPIVRFIVAIDAAFSDAPEKAQAAVERVLFIARDALRFRSTTASPRHSSAYSPWPRKSVSGSTQKRDLKASRENAGVRGVQG